MRQAKTLEQVIDCFFRLDTTLTRLTGVRPVFVLDGARSEQKERYTAFQRSASKQRLSDLPHYQDVFVPGYREILAESFASQNVELVIAPDGYEAEEVCARLASHSDLAKPGIVVTEDSDALVFGAPAVLTGVWSKSHPSLIELPEVLQALEVSSEQLIDVSLMCGCDFASKLPGVGFTRAVAAVKQFGTIEKYLEHRKKTNPKWAIEHFFVTSFDYVSGRENFTRSLDFSKLFSTATDRKLLLANILLPNATAAAECISGKSRPELLAKSVFIRKNAGGSVALKRYFCTAVLRFRSELFAIKSGMRSLRSRNKKVYSLLS